MPDYFARVALVGKRLRLEPLSQKHLDDLWIAGELTCRRAQQGPLGGAKHVAASVS